MRLVIGGRGQGKKIYVHGLGYDWEEMKPCLGEQPVVVSLEDIVARLLKDGQDPLAVVLRHADAHPDAVYVCTEMGCGVVPVDRFQREWREAAGRVCCALAAKASRVERIFCGLPMVLKEEEA